MDVSIERLRRYLVELASAPRPPESVELERVRQTVESLLRETGWHVRRHAFNVADVSGINLVATRDGGGSSAGRPRFCLGAHLDSRFETPGADDNASGVAALLEVARLLPTVQLEQRAVDVELVVFDLEELGMLGGAEHARLTQENGVNLQGMVALEMIAYCDPAAGSQQLPRALVGKYPDTGDFIAVIGNQVSAGLIERFRTGLAGVAGLPVETLAVPENGQYLQASRLSDHSPFWDAGYPALMITDTSFLRNPHYHLSTDTPDTLDFDFLAKVTQGVLNATDEILRRGL